VGVAESVSVPGRKGVSVAPGMGREGVSGAAQAVRNRRRIRLVFIW
jgi:hypothetical protein